MSGNDAQGSFRRLGLLPDADARAVRRAYACELKKIDQALDAPGFQQLRTAYDAALESAHRQVESGASTAPDEVAAASVATSAPLPLTPSAEQMADAAADDFCAVLAQLGGQYRGGGDLPYQEALRQALAGERLFNIDARHGFELRVAVLLVRGWRPGHEALLVAAATVFGWSLAARLSSLGQAGSILDRALEERAVYDSQSMAAKATQRDVLRLLRDPDRASAALIAQYMPVLAGMLARFPNWLPIVAPRASVAWWQEQTAATERADDDDEATSMSLAQLKNRLSTWAKRLAVVMACLIGLAMCSDRVHLFRQAPPGAAFHAPHVVDPPEPYDSHLTRIPGAAITQARFDDIVARIGYQPGAWDADRTYKAEFDVFLNPAGEPVGANPVSASGNAKLDAAIRAAIMGSAPFPAQTKRVFSLVFTYAPDERRRP